MAAKPVPLGPPLPLATLLALARVTAADVTAADALWQATAPAPLRRLLRATRLAQPPPVVTHDVPTPVIPRGGQT